MSGIKSKAVTQWFLRLLISLFFFVLTACGGNDSGSAENIAESKATTELPSGLQKLALTGGGTLTAYATIDGDAANRKIMTINSAGAGSASVSIPGLSRAPHTIVIRYFYAVGGENYLLAIAVKNIDLSSGSGSLFFRSLEYDTDSFDYDSDNISNVAELKAGTSPGIRTDITAPVFTSGRRIRVPENTTVTGYTAVATDADGSTVRYSLVGGVDQALFSIDSNTGVLSFKNPVDFEAPVDSDQNNTYVLGIMATDGVNPVAQSVTVTISDTALESFSVIPQYRSVLLNGNEKGADSYNLYYSSDKAFDTNNYLIHNDGTYLTNVSLPMNVSKLDNGKAYYFVLEAVYGSKKILSAEISGRPNELAFNGFIFAMDAAADGRLYLGGDFTSVGVVSGGGVAVKSTSGRPGAGDYPLVDGTVYAVVTDNQGGWYIGGSFRRVGGLARNNLAHLLADGSVDSGWDPSASSVVYALGLSTDGKTLYAGGNFTVMGGKPRNYLASIGADGSLGSWDPNANGVVRALAVSADGKTVYVGGGFTTMGAGGATRNYLAAIGTDGSLGNWDPDAGAAVRALAISADGKTVYVGGLFTTMGGAGGTTRNYLATIGTDGSLGNWDPNADGVVVALAVSVDGKTVYVGGGFNKVGGITRSRIAAIGTDGSLGSWNPKANSTVYALAVSADGKTVYAGGVFTTISGVPRYSLAAIGTDGSLGNWNPNAGGTVVALGLSANTKDVYVGGVGFSTMGGGIPRNRLAAIGADGSLGSWDPNANNIVYALEVSADSKTVYVGGAFTRVSGITRNRIAALGTDGSLANWDPNANSTVHALVASVDGKTVYMGGSFTAVGGTGGVTRTRIAAIGTDGSLGSWDPNANNTVRSLAVSADGKTVYVGGFFTTMGVAGVTRNYLAAIGADGSLASWDPNANNIVVALGISADGKTVYAGGDFTAMGVAGVSRNYLAAIGTDGSLSSWDPNAGAAVRALVISVDGKTVYVGGWLTNVAGTNRGYLAAIGTDGSLGSWNPRADSIVYALAVSADGKTVYMGGRFSNIGVVLRGNFAAIGTDGVLK